MNYPEELREKFNECMYDERDLIMDFLKDTADLSMGNQMYEYTLEPMPQLLGFNGEMYMVREICLDPEWLVNFKVEKKEGGFATFHCHDFAYGELSKIIEMLPDVEKYKREDILGDLENLYVNVRLDILLNETPFNLVKNEHAYMFKDVKMKDGEIVFDTGLNKNVPASEIPVDVVKDLRDYIHVEILRRSDEYKALVEILKGLEANAYNFCDHNDFCAVYLTPDGTDLSLPIFDVCIHEGRLEISVSIDGTRIGDETGDSDMMLEEKDLTIDNLKTIVKYLKSERNILSYGLHGEGVVDSVNDAWRQEKYKRNMRIIIFAMCIKYVDEFRTRISDTLPNCYEDLTDKQINRVLESLCNDSDLESILNFINYQVEGD